LIFLYFDLKNSFILNAARLAPHMLRSQFLLEVSGGADDSAASRPLQASARNLEEPTSAKICAHCILTVLNTSQRIVSFKVLTNSQNRYSIRPSIGILQPSQSVDITVGVSRKHASDPAGVILLRYVKLPSDWSLQNDLASFWSNAPKGKVKALKLVQSVFEPDSANYSLHSSFSEVSSAHGNGSPVIDADSDFRVTPVSSSSGNHKSSCQLRSADNDQSRPVAAHDSREHPPVNWTASTGRGIRPISHVDVPTAVSYESGVPGDIPLNAGPHSSVTAEVSRIPRVNLESVSSMSSFIPVETRHMDDTIINTVNDSGCTAGQRSDSRASTLSDYSHRTDDPLLGIDQDMVAQVEKMRAAVSSVKERPKTDLSSHMHRRTRTKDSGSSEAAKSTEVHLVDAPASLSRSSIDPSSQKVDGETPSTAKRSRYPPVEVCVSSISRVSSGFPSIMSRLFPSASLSDQKVYVKMDPHMLQLSEGDCEELLLLLRWKDVVAMSVRVDSTATILLLLNGNSGNAASFFRDIKVCDSLISDVHHKLHLLSIKGSADTVCRMAVHASRCPGNELQSLPHVRWLFPFITLLTFLQWLWVAAQLRFPGSGPFRAMLSNSALSLPHVCRLFCYFYPSLIRTFLPPPPPPLPPYPHSSHYRSFSSLCFYLWEVALSSS
jgi:hypothetical protein